MKKGILTMMAAALCPILTGSSADGQQSRRQQVRELNNLANSLNTQGCGRSTGISCSSGFTNTEEIYDLEQRPSCSLPWL